MCVVTWRVCLNFKATRSSRLKVNDGKQEISVDTAMPSPESLSSSIKVQTGDSTGTSVVDLESISLNQPMQKRVRVQVAKLQVNPKKELKTHLLEF